MDLDSGLLKTNSLWEAVLKAIRIQPSIVLLVPYWLAQGKSTLMQALARCADLDPMNWPRHTVVEKLVAETKSSGRTVELISANHDLFRNRPPFCKMFHNIVGGSDGADLCGEARAKLLLARHPQGFAYLGNNATDLPIWRVARECFAVNLSSSTRRRASGEGIDLVELATASDSLSNLLKSMRLHQWLKNSSCARSARPHAASSGTR